MPVALQHCRQAPHTDCLAPAVRPRPAPSTLAREIVGVSDWVRGAGAGAGGPCLSTVLCSTLTGSQLLAFFNQTFRILFYVSFINIMNFDSVSKKLALE